MYVSKFPNTLEICTFAVYRHGFVDQLKYSFSKFWGIVDPFNLHLDQKILETGSK